MLVKLKNTLDLMSLIATHATTEMSELEKMMFYVKLDLLVEQCPFRDTLIVLGDILATAVDLVKLSTPVFEDLKEPFA